MLLGHPLSLLSLVVKSGGLVVLVVRMVTKVSHNVMFVIM